MMICTVLIRVHFLLHCEQVSHEGMCQTLKLHTSKLDSSCEHLWKYMLRKGGKVIMWGWCSTQLGIVGPGRAGGPWGEHPLHPLASSCADLNTHQSTFSIRVMNFGWIFWKVTIANLHGEIYSHFRVKVKAEVKALVTLSYPTVAHQAPLSMEFSREEYWMGCHSLLQGIFLTQGLSSQLSYYKADSLPSESAISYP